MPYLCMPSPYLIAYWCIFCGDFVRWVYPCFVLQMDFSPCSISCLILSYMRWKESSRMWQDNFCFFPVLNLSCGSPWANQRGRELHSRQQLTSPALHGLGREEDAVPYRTDVIYNGWMMANLGLFSHVSLKSISVVHVLSWERQSDGRA